MSQRRKIPFLVVVGVLPFALAACNAATSSLDPRTQSPLVRVATVESSAPAERSFKTVLSDIVRKDADPNVRSEALQGIYRLRTDASIDALIQLYDAVADVKVKGDILSNLLRRNKDNSKAIAKLAAVAKTEKDETLRSRALRRRRSITCARR